MSVHDDFVLLLKWLEIADDDACADRDQAIKDLERDDRKYAIPAGKEEKFWAILVIKRFLTRYPAIEKSELNKMLLEKFANSDFHHYHKHHPKHKPSMGR